ncbi:HAD-IIA family hydrolase [Labedaea rhizosphaerae]|uniref:HAD superfamily hydrolase (TIGR01450 family) n=1 Tax=Labedaea rhizosphaerae TaxID=598644 RepID=A0A4R6RUJ4_LABRH|nr:HAD-IIA family hydrolase [Labedaea rhizosphaerae]TDP90464.1 HAD superfamily hydrolase (TIGR01450 family) [Labedaea rhizosphaerae]
MSLLDDYDAVLFDLDGTIYRGGEVIPTAAAAVQAAHDRNVVVRFVTNNASRAPHTVGDQLRDMGIAADDGEVSTSAQAAATVAKERLETGGDVLVIGTEALADEIRNVGLNPVRAFHPDVVGVVQGLSQDTGWRELSEAVLAIRNGALWIACNADATLPTERGQLVGNGAMVAAVRTATNQEPIVAGKPEAPLMRAAAEGTTKPLAVGDRIDTDIAGARNAGIDALLVLTGVSTPRDLLNTTQRPRYVAADVGALTSDDDLEITENGDWDVDGDIAWRGEGEPDPLALLRALCAAHDHMPDDLRAADDQAAKALHDLGLDHIN